MPETPLPPEPRSDTRPSFEAFALWTRAATSPEEVAALVHPVLGDGWRVEPIPSEGGKAGFELVHPDLVLSEQAAWEKTYALRALPGVEHAEPLFEVAVFEREPTETRPGLEAAERVKDHLPASEDRVWALKMLRVDEAIEAFFGGDPMRAGRGVVIGHPDTGYHHHPEIVDALVPEKGWDFVREDGDPLDDLLPSKKVVVENPGHGIATSSVIVSPPGAQPAEATWTAVDGVAPGAKLIPIRCTRTVILLSMRRLAHAIEFAVDQGAHVISMSLGGVPSRRLHQAIRYAERRGVIVCAAAGNQVRFVVWPANYAEVVACAACNADRKPWRGSSRGPTVDVTAPGESVWRAFVTRDGQTGEVSYGTGRGSGTSYAVAHVAGIAALWLARHGRDALVSRYGPAKLPSVFRALVARSCVRLPDLDGRYGAGLLDAKALLAHPLPDAGGLERAPRPPAPPDPETELEQLFGAVGAGGLESTARAGDGPAPEGVRRTLAELFETDPASLDQTLDEVGDELLFHLMTRPADYDRLRAAAERRPSPLEAASRPADLARVRNDLRQEARSTRLQSAL